MSDPNNKRWKKGREGGTRIRMELSKTCNFIYWRKFGGIVDQ